MATTLTHNDLMAVAQRDQAGPVIRVEGVEVRIGGAFQHVTDPRPGKEQPPGSQALHPQDAKPLVEQDRSDGEAHAEGVDRARALEQHAVVVRQMGAPEQPPRALTPGGGSLHQPPGAPPVRQTHPVQGSPPGVSRRPSPREEGPDHRPRR